MLAAAHIAPLDSHLVTSTACCPAQLLRSHTAFLAAAAAPKKQEEILPLEALTSA